MIRAAAKNHAYATVVVSPASYDAVLEELRISDGALSPQTRESLAAEAFAYTARYDTSIARWFAERAEDFPDLYVRAFEKVLDLPYGENPHQRAAYYAQVGARLHVLSMIRQHHGKQLSYNNLLDLDAARRIGREFEVPACVIVKHNNPCGVGVGRNGQEAYERAFSPTRSARSAA
jgi:phosphoribosylaminoimidazolecarboxamide formyltransferase/IMP cyclohydrolase